MSFTPYNAPLLSGLLGDMETAGFFSVKADLAAMVRFEVALAGAQAGVGLIPQQAAEAIAQAAEGFEPDMTRIASQTAKDGVTGPAFVNCLRDAVGEPHGRHLHKGATSQDLIDTSLMLRLCDLIPALSKRLDEGIELLQQLAQQHGPKPLMAHTRMQRALPITVSHKVDMWCEPLQRLRTAKPTVFPLQLGGPEGALSGMGEVAQPLTAALGQALGLAAPARNWQTDRSPLIDIMNWATKLTTALGKIGQDIALMAQNEVGEVALSGGGRSSAMAHKNNPVLAESLVTLARFNATQMGGLHQAALHENERSGAAWSLEWMLVPQIMVATGASLRNTVRLIRQIEIA